MIGSSIVRGRSIRILATASLTSLTARSMSISSRNSIAVSDDPSVMVEVTCLTPVMLATASSISLVTCDSSSAGAEPDWFTVTATTGTSILGKRVIGSALNETMPSSMTTVKKTSAGTGLRIDHAETLSAMVIEAPAQGLLLVWTVLWPG